MRRLLFALATAVAVTAGGLASTDAVATPAGTSCNFDVTWTAKRHSGGEDPRHRAVVTAEKTRYNGHTYWGLNLAWSAFPGNRIGCYALTNVNGEVNRGSGPGGTSLCSGDTCDTANRYVKLRFNIIRTEDVAKTSSLRSDLPSKIDNSETKRIRGHLRWRHGDPGQRSVSLEWWPQSGNGLSHVCHFKPNTTVDTTSGPRPVYLTPADGDFTARLRPGCFPSRGYYLVAVSTLAGFPGARSSKQTVHVIN